MSDGCQIVNSTIPISVTCQAIPVTPTLTVVPAVGNISAIVTFAPNDTTTSIYTRSWTVTSPAGNIVPNNIAFVGGISLTQVTLPGNYVVALTLTNACGANLTVSTTYNSPAQYTITPRTQYTSQISAVVGTVNNTFPQVSFDANTTVLSGISYDYVKPNAYWYFISLPASSAIPTNAQ